MITNSLSWEVTESLQDWNKMNWDENVSIK